MPTICSGGDAIVQALLGQGVDTLFGLPGVQNDHFFNALYDQGDKMRVIHTRHEQGAAYMALGYALSSRRAGVYSVVPGPGVLNTTAALSTAYARNSQVLCLTGQIQSDQIGRGTGLLHEIPDQLGILRALTKWAARINSPAEAPQLVAEAFRQMASGRPRPAALEVPPDVLAARTEVDLAPVIQPPFRPPVSTDAIEAAARLLGAARNPLIFVGGGAVDAGASLLRLAEMLQAPVISSYNGHGILSSRHYLNHTYTAGNRLWAEADVVLAVGTRLQTPLSSWGIDDQLKLIRIDIDPLEHIRHGRPDISLIADACDALTALLPAVEAHASARPSRQDEMLELKALVEAECEKVKPQIDFVRAIRAELPDDGFFVEEMTQIGYVSRYALPIYKPRTYVSTGYQGTLGWGFATALGVKIANPDKPVLSINGDGGFMFTVQELATAVQHGINTVSIVFNDNAYGNVQRMQKELHGNRVIASELRNPDFVQLAESFGALGLRAHTPAEMRQAIRQGFAAHTPTLIEVPVNEMPNPRSLYFLPKVRPVK